LLKAFWGGGDLIM